MQQYSLKAQMCAPKSNICFHLAVKHIVHFIFGKVWESAHFAISDQSCCKGKAQADQT